MRTFSYIILFTVTIQLFPTKLSAQNDSFEIGFILANLFVERWQKDKMYFEEKVNELGGSVIFKDCYDQPENQITAAKELIEAKVDAIVIIAVDAVAAAPIVTLSKESNIPVIAYDRLILNAPLDYYITFNSIKVGEIMARTVISAIPEGTILYLGGPSDDHNSVFIRQGVFNVLNTVKDRYTIHSTQVFSWTELDSYLHLQDYLSNHAFMPNAIICAADVLTRGAIAVLEENKKFGEVLLTGQDAELDICRYIAQEKIDITLYKPGKLLAERAADEVVKIIAKENLPPNETTFNGMVDVPSIFLEPVPVTIETLESTVIKDGYYTHDQIFKRKLP